ncbi:MAG TPA: nuclear transport factor 2 family protein [Pseudonocardiaceae bacterium]|nr:nuclear transport factor 2 family protein [Pseudonocardiaceae bacterium]
MGGIDQSAAVTAAIADHARLSYLYLDDGDLDAYGSLLADNVRLLRPDLPNVVGRARVLAELAPIAGPPGRHRLYRVIADGDRVAAEGSYTGPWRTDVDFVDIMTFSADGLMLDQCRYYATPIG